MIRYRLEPADLHAHLFRVTVTIARPAAEQRLSLPVWIPGSYLVREFARHLLDLQARQGERVVPVEQLDKATWLVRCGGDGGDGGGRGDIDDDKQGDSDSLKVSYRIYANDPSVRAAFLDAQRGFFNGTSVFLRVHGREHEAQRLSLGALPADWRVATALQPLDGNGDDRDSDRDGGSDSGTEYVAADYDELVDHPVELGRFWRGTFSAAGVPHDVVVAGALPSFDAERLLADVQRICEQQIAFWHGDADGDRQVDRQHADRQADLQQADRQADRHGARPAPASAPPFRRYVFLLNATDDGYGGLEHRASTALIGNRRDLPRKGCKAGAENYTTLLGLISHEYFHTWNVKRLRPSEFARYDYTRENHTALLWFFEGFTSYYDDLFLRRAGLVDVPRYLKLLAKGLNNVLGTPGRTVQSVAQASFDAWVKYYRPDENTVNATVSYYTKGSMVALALDLALRGGVPPAATGVSLGGGLDGGADGGVEGNAADASLDAVMRRLWSLGDARDADGRPVGGPIAEADIAAALADVAGRPCTRELAEWVHGTGELPLQPLLARIGVAWSEDAPTLAQKLGARVAAEGGGMKLQAVLRGGAAEQAGLAAGDELIALDGWRLKRLDDLTPLGAFERPLPLLAARDGRLLALTLPAAQAAGAVTLTLDAQADAATQARRTRWLGPG